MVKKIMLLFLGILLVPLSCRQEYENLNNSLQQNNPIEAFDNFEKKINQNPDFKKQNTTCNDNFKQATSKTIQSQFTSNVSEVSYRLPFIEVIENYMVNNPEFRDIFNSNLGNVSYRISTVTYGKPTSNAKGIAFPIIKDGRVNGILVGIISPDRTYVEFRAVSNEEPNTISIMDNFQNALDNSMPDSPVPNGKFTTYSIGEKEIKESLIEEVIITKISDGRFSPGYYDISYNNNWYKDYIVRRERIGSGGSGLGQAMSGGSDRHKKFPNYLDPNDDPCEKARELAKKMSEILNNNDINTAIQLIGNLIQQQIANGQIKENAFAIGVDSNGKYHVSSISTATDSNPHKVGYNHFDPNSGITQVGVFHNHTSDNSNSAGDFYELISSNMKYPSYVTNFAQNSLGEVFALNIYDRQKAIAFLQKYPKDQNIDGPEFKGILLDEYEKFRSTADWTLNNNTNAGQVALIAFLEKFDTGVSLSKRIDAFSFKTFKSSSFSQTIYGGQQQTIYTTTDCN